MKSDRRPTTDSNKPSKHFRLTCWRLLYHLDVQKPLDRQDEIDACGHSHHDLDRWDEQKARFPREWAKVLVKRQRRLDWFTEHGSVPDGWTPPDPKDPRRTSHKPIHAYLARRKLTLEEFEAENGHIPLKSKKYRGRSKTNWHVHRRIRTWQNERRNNSL
jgi:hypothetical protein